MRGLVAKKRGAKKGKAENNRVNTGRMKGRKETESVKREEQWEKGEEQRRRRSIRRGERERERMEKEGGR